MSTVSSNHTLKWSDIMSEEIMQIGDALTEKANTLRQTQPIYPPQNQIFRALKLTPPEKLKVCIIGQDPYNTPGAANGLAFSINKGRPIQPSLQNIFKELHDDIGCPIPTSGDLTPWAEQGVLLLNTALTVGSVPNSHRDWGWQTFTHHVYELATKLPQPVVFILWGSNARHFADNTPKQENKMTLYAPHPSPLSAYRGFFGSKPFSKTNTFLVNHGSTPINWAL